ncbi:MAG: DevR family CRISPR-associated autoregulator [Candidatus Goldbacteria bacterium]|nr:DevR family CRISPR-associated autoregulator [Candidatus Goldiibacteriota bacterium]
MSKHLFGIVVTPHGIAANNRGETEGNITTLQKILWRNEVYTTVSAEAIRFAIRWNWQLKKGEENINRRWVDNESHHIWANSDFKKWDKFIDDDVLGFMNAKAGKEEGNDAENKDEDEEENKGAKSKKVRGTCDKRRARLEVTRAISLTPFAGDITFNAASVGATPSASSTGGKDPVPYGTEIHATRYQYGFALTPEELADKKRVIDVIDAITTLSRVAGNQARFLFDFSPESIIFRWTNDFAPRILYGFNLKDNNLVITDVIKKVISGDVDAKELIVGGNIADTEEGKQIKNMGANVFSGIKEAANETIKLIKKDLNL